MTSGPTSVRSRIVLSHPTGNEFVRALLSSLQERGELHAFCTTVALHPDDWFLRLLPQHVRNHAVRRSYDVPRHTLRRTPVREATRLLSARIGLRGLSRHEKGWASVDAVYRDLDKRVAHSLEKDARLGVTSVYCYEDCAQETFRRARSLGLKCLYDLPIAYWKTGVELLEEETWRWPEWEPTLVATRDSAAKHDRKERELALADAILAPSLFVRDSLPEEMRVRCHVVEFGSPPASSLEDLKADDARDNSQATGQLRPLRVLFAGSMSQRKGLADLFAAMKMLARRDVELIVMGSMLAPPEFYRKYSSEFRYEAPRPHAKVLELMDSCDVLALPSIVEGRALVQQEALSCGLPLIVTPNAGGQDLIEEGRTGFLVPIRSPECIAEKITWFADHRAALPEMRRAAKEKAAQYTWARYGNAIADVAAACC